MCYNYYKNINIGEKYMNRVQKLASFIISALIVCGFFSTLPIYKKSAAVIASTEWYDELSSTYEISTVSHLAGLSMLSNVGETFEGKTIKLTADIVYNDPTNRKSWNTQPPDNVFRSIGLKSGFNGVFDGGGHTISGLYIMSSDSNTGMFSKLYGAEIKNLKVTDSYIVGRSNTGGIAGFAQRSVFEKATFDGQINGTTYVGGICGFVDTSELGNTLISNCTVTGNIVATSYGGGIAGYCNGKTNLTDCKNFASVSAMTSYAGGISARFLSGNLSLSCNMGTVVASANYSAGLVARTEYGAKISGCYNTASISSDNIASGLVCENFASVSVCYNTGDVTSNTSMCGLVTLNNGLLSGCYFTGKLKGMGGKLSGIVLENSGMGEVRDCYFVSDTTMPAIQEDKGSSKFVSQLNKSDMCGKNFFVETSGYEIKNGDFYPAIEGFTYADCDNASGWAEHLIADGIITYNIYYELSGGVFSEGVDAVGAYRRGDTLALVTETELVLKDGFVFAGWYDNPDFTGQPITAITADNRGNMTLYAKWVEGGSTSVDTPKADLTWLIILITVLVVLGACAMFVMLYLRSKKMSIAATDDGEDMQPERSSVQRQIVTGDIDNAVQRMTANMHKSDPIAERPSYSIPQRQKVKTTANDGKQEFSRLADYDDDSDLLTRGQDFKPIYITDQEERYTAAAPPRGDRVSADEETAYNKQTGYAAEEQSADSNMRCDESAECKTPPIYDDSNDSADRIEENFPPENDVANDAELPVAETSSQTDGITEHAVKAECTDDQESVPQPNFVMFTNDEGKRNEFDGNQFADFDSGDFDNTPFTED